MCGTFVKKMNTRMKMAGVINTKSQIEATEFPGKNVVHVETAQHELCGKDKKCHGDGIGATPWATYVCLIVKPVDPISQACMWLLGRSCLLKYRHRLHTTGSGIGSMGRMGLVRNVAGLLTSRLSRLSGHTIGERYGARFGKAELG